MPVAVSNLHNNSVNVNGSFDEQEKKTLRKLADTGVGIIAVCTAQENGSASTTPANTDLRINGLKAGRRYLIKGNVRMSNATGGNGARAAIVVTGTQTSATVLGTVYGLTELTTPTLTGIAASGGAVRAALATSYGANGTAAGSNFVEIYFDNIIFIPQNDGDLIVQVGSNTGTTQSRLDVGSYVAVQEITF